MLNVLNRAAVKIRAEETLMAIRVAAIGACTMKKEDRAAVIRDLNKAAVAGKRPQLTREAAKIYLATMGIGVKSAGNKGKTG